MEYRLPRIEDKAIMQDYVREHKDNGETSVSACMGYFAYEFEEWVKKINDNATVGDETGGKSLLYLCFVEGKHVGLLSIRYELPEELSLSIGDIGYGVRPSMRNKGFATKMLRYGLGVCKERGMDKVILGCYKDNLASARTIEKCGGVLFSEGDNYHEGRVSRYYEIKLK